MKRFMGRAGNVSRAGGPGTHRPIGASMAPPHRSGRAGGGRRGTESPTATGLSPIGGAETGCAVTGNGAPAFPPTLLARSVHRTSTR